MNSSLLISDSVFIDVSESKFKFNNELSSCEFSDDNAQKIDTTLSDVDDLHSKSLNNSQSQFEAKKSAPINMTREEAMKLVNIAATLLQANIKRYLHQKKYKEYLLKHKSAIKIQAVWRGYSDRNLNKTVIEKFKFDLPIKILQQRLNYQDIMYQKSIQAIFTSQENLTAAIYALTCQVESLKKLSFQPDTQPNSYIEIFPCSVEKYNSIMQLDSKSLHEHQSVESIQSISKDNDTDDFSSISFMKKSSDNFTSESMFQEVKVHSLNKVLNNESLNNIESQQKERK